jgi:nicotinamide riboside kinase
MFNKRIKAFYSTITDSFLFVLDSDTLSYTSVFLKKVKETDEIIIIDLFLNNDYNKHTVSFDYETILKELQTTFSDMNLSTNSVTITPDTVQYRMSEFMNNEYKDVTHDYTNEIVKEFNSTYVSIIDKVPIKKYLRTIGLKNVNFIDNKDINKTFDKPNIDYKFKFNSEQNYTDKNLDISNYKFKMKDRTLYSLITKGDLYKEIMGQVNSPREFSNTRNFLLLGPAGGGKSQLVNAIAETLDAPFASINCHNRLDQDTFFSSTTVTVDETTGQHKWVIVYTDLFYVLTNGGIIFLDEFNALTHEAQIMWNAIAEGQKKTILVNSKTYKVSDDLIIFAAGNVGYQGTKSINPATKSRFQQFSIPTLEQSSYLKKVNTAPSMKPHIKNGNTKLFVNFLFTVKNHLDNYLQDKRNVIEPPMIINRTMDYFFDKLFVEYDFTKAFTSWVQGMFHTTSLTEKDVKMFIDLHSDELTDLDRLFKLVYITEQPIEIKEETKAEELIEPIINPDKLTDLIKDYASVIINTTTPTATVNTTVSTATVNTAASTYDLDSIVKDVVTKGVK